jgi:hypothetical protein
MLVATISGAKIYVPWEQVTLLWESGVNISLLVGHPHFFRYLVAYPGFIFEDIYPGIGFSIYIAAFVVVNQILFQGIAKLINSRQPTVTLQSIFFLAHFAMNGRGALAWTGWLVCMLVCLRMASLRSTVSDQLPWIAVSCLLSSVTTGVFIVVVVTLSYFILAQPSTIGRRGLLRSVKAIVLGLPLGLVVSDHFWIAINKNIEYYGGGYEGAVNMLNHGIGIAFGGQSLPALLLGAALSSGLILGILYFIRGRPLNSLERFALVAISGGMFGFTVLTLSIPPLLLRTHQVTPRMLRRLPRQ